jgi:hypothetical protein
MSSELNQYYITLNSVKKCKDGYHHLESSRFEAACFVFNKVSELKGTSNADFSNHGYLYSDHFIVMLSDAAAQEIVKYKEYVLGVKKQ